MFASADATVKLYAISDNQLEQISVYKPKKSSSTVTHLSWCHDNTYLGILQKDSYPQIVSAKDRCSLNLVHTIQALPRVSVIQFKRHTKRSMALGSADGEVILYDTKNRNVLKKVCSLTSPVTAMDFNSKDEQLAVASDDSVHLFADPDAINNFVQRACYAENCSVLKYHPQQHNLLAVGYESGRVAIRDTEKNEVIISFHKHCASISGIDYSNKQKAVITAGIDKKICVYDYANSECLFRINMHQGITCCSISTDEIYLAVGLEDGCISIYDIRDPLKPMITHNAHNSPVTAISFEKGPKSADCPAHEKSCTTLDTTHLDEEPESAVIDEKFKQDIAKMIKHHMGYLDAQLQEHCSKFQNFIANEFESIHNAMSRWDVFNVGDGSEVAEAIGSASSNSIRTAKKPHCN